jgi:pyruvate dehydrogenase E2 component (dihydrolipoyllysine-residue acetyltransferase)
MPIEITMPRLSDTMEEGTLIKWRVKVGDQVESGDVLADVETDKATMELQAYDDGMVAKLAVEEGGTTPVGKLILVLAEKGESLEDAAAAAGDGEATPSKPAKSQAEKPREKEEAVEADDAAVKSSASASKGADRVRVSPLAAKLADERGLGLSRIEGTGPGGRIIKRDVLAAAGEGGAKPQAAAKVESSAKPQAAAAPAAKLTLEDRTISVTSMRKTIARRLVESKTTIPHFTVTVAVNMEPLLALRQTLNAQLEAQGLKLSVNDFIVRAAALALLQHPMVNASWTDSGIRLHGTVNMGVAVALPEEKGGGLVVPVVRDAQNKGLRQVNAETKQLADKARGAGLSPQDMADGTFTISNLGMFGVDHFEAIINPPQAAILAVGAAMAKPVVRDGQIVAGQEMTCTLSCDHRVVDGAIGAQYLATLKELLENPAAMLV